METPAQIVAQRPALIRRSLRLPAREFEAPVRGVISSRARRTVGGRCAMAGLAVFLILTALTTIFPLYWLFISSLKSPREIVTFPPSLWPKHVTWSAYSQAWTSLNFKLYFINSLWMVTGSVVFRVGGSALAAYALAKLNPPMARTITFAILLVVMIPGVAYFVPEFVTVTHLPVVGGTLINTWWGIWLPGMGSPVLIYLFKNFFEQIPAEVTEAALVDGAGTWRVFTRIILPMSKPVLGVATVYTIINVWQDFLWPLLVLPDEKLWPLEVGLYRLQAQQVPLNVQMAGMVIATLPMIAVFMLFQRQIIRGVVTTTK